MSADRFRPEIKFVGGRADIWRLFDEASMLRDVADALVEPFQSEVTKVAGIESRGFILGTAAAIALDVGFIPIRKADGVFPGPKALAEASTDWRGNQHTLRLQRAALSAEDRILLVDDWIETGSQALAAKKLIESCGARMIAVATVVTQAPPDVLAELGTTHALLSADELPV